MMDTSHAFLLPGDKLGETIVVDVQGADGKFSRREIAVPLLADLAVMGDSHKPPVISGVQVLKVQRGVFLSATIGWQTDSLAFAQVRYGDKELSQTSEQGKRLGRRHEVVLYELQLDRTYRFAAVSSDFFGLRQVSETFEFSTVNPYEAPLPPATSGNPLEGGTEARLDSGFQRVGADYLLELTLEQPAAVYVGSKGEARQQNVSAESTAGALAADDKIHTGLSSQMVISLDACRTCHTDQSRATHPVNVYPKPAMAIPPEYPTLSDGRITCNSCHVPHGSDYEYLSRKARKRELCIGCHKDIL
jgi:predicted CXXCH cytochrome family protein